MGISMKNEDIVTKVLYRMGDVIQSRLDARMLSFLRDHYSVSNMKYTMSPFTAMELIRVTKDEVNNTINDKKIITNLINYIQRYQ